MSETRTLWWLPVVLLAVGGLLFTGYVWGYYSGFDAGQKDDSRVLQLEYELQRQRAAFAVDQP